MDTELRAWLDRLGLSQYAKTFEEHDIDLDVLPDLTDQELSEIGVSLGHRKRILKSVAAIWPEPSSPQAGPGKPSIEDRAERRQLTVMFCDLVGSTMLSVRYDPEDLRQIIMGFQKCCEEVVARLGGNVARYMGDGLLVYFGYPKADEYDAERAVRAGREVIDAVGKLAFDEDLVLQTRVGIATGDVIVGDLLSGGLTQERQVVGETPNLAARLQSLAEPDSVVIGDTTKKLAGGLFEYEDLGRHELKGFDKPVSAWRVTRELDIPDRYEARRAAPQALVGRGDEVDTLERQFEQACAGHGGTVLLRGQAGIGKSRVLHALRDRIAGTPHETLAYFCSAHRQNSALFPVIRQIERAAGINSEDSGEDKLRKLEASLEVAAQDIPGIVPLYAALLSIPTDGRYPPLTLSPRLQKQKLFECLHAQLSLLAERGPVLIVFEDLHWVDPTTLELIETMIRQVSDLPVMLLMTARSDVEMSLDEEGVRSLTVGRMGDEQGAALVSQTAGGKAVADEVVARILAKADGIPLFIEELTKTLLDSEQLNETDEGYKFAGPALDVEIPATLKDSLMARLDRLAEAKSVAQIGAAIGRDFPYALLAEVVHQDAAHLAGSLEQLQASGLLTKSGEGAEAFYQFHHALIRDAAYSSLLRDQRRSIHLDIAAKIESLFPTYAETQPDVLAHHYTQGEDFPQAIDWWHRAGSHAQQRAATVEAIQHFTTGLELIDKLKDEALRDRQEMKLRVSLGPSLEARLGYSSTEVEENYRLAYALATKLEAGSQTVPVLLGLFVFRLVRGELSTALELAEQCLEASEASGEHDLLMESLAALGFVQCYVGDLEAAAETLSRCASVHEQHGEQAFRAITAQHPVVSALALLPIIHWLAGYPDRSLDRLHDAFALARRTPHPINLAIVHAHAAQLYQMRREPAKALEHGQLGVQISEKHGLDTWHLANAFHVGIALNCSGHEDQGVPTVAQCLAAWAAVGAALNKSYYLAGQAIGEAASGNEEAALALVDQALESVRDNGEHYFEAHIRNVRGEIYRDGGALEQAESDFSAAIETARRYRCRMIELRAMCNLERLYLEKGQGKDVSADLKALYDSFSEGFATRDFQDVDELLSRD